MSSKNREKVRKLITKIEEAKDFCEIESSGSSVVMTCPESDNTFQVYISSDVAKRITGIMIKLREKNPVKLRIYLAKGFGARKQVFIDRELIYDAFSYIVLWKLYFPDWNTIVWNKITPLNKIPDKIEVMKRNLYKIMYDVCKGLKALHLIGIIHNDAVLDNVGIQGNNFVLFDFDGSGTSDEKGKDFHNDYTAFCGSIKYNLDIDVNINSVSSVIQLYSEKEGLTIPDSFTALERMRIDL